MRNITARSYSCTTCAIFEIFEYSWGPFAFSINISVKAPLSRTHLEADEEREWNSDEEHAPESNSELRADKEKDGREHHESQRRKKPQKPMLAVSPAKKRLSTRKEKMDWPH